MGDGRGGAARRARDTWSTSTCPPTSSGRSPTTPPTSRWPRRSAGSSPSGACCAWPGPRSSAAATPRRGSRPSVREEMWAHHEPRGAQYMGVNWVGPTIMRHGTPEQQRTAPAADRPRRGHLVPGLQRAGRRLGPGVAADRGPARRRRVAGLRPEDLDLVRHHGPVVLPAGPHLARARSKQQGLTDLPRADVRPGDRGAPDPPRMLGPHHLNEVFFDDLRVTEADVLGTVDEGWKVVQEVLAFERVGIARYARCERLLQAAPARARRRVGRPARRSCAAAGRGCSRTAGGPGCSPTGWSSLQSSGRVTPGDTAAYRIAVTRLDQDSAEVLMEIVGRCVDRPTTTRRAVPPCGRGPLALLAGVHRGVGQHRDAADPAGPSPAGGVMNIDLSDEAVEFGRQALRAFEAAGGDELVQVAEARARSARATSWRRCSPSSARGTSTPAATPTSSRRRPRCAAAPATGRCAYPVAERLSRPTDLDVDGLVVVADTDPAGGGGGARPVAGSRSTLDGQSQHRHARSRRARRRARPRSSTELDLEPIDDDGASDVALGLVLPCWTLLGMLDRAHRPHRRARARARAVRPAARRRSRACSSSSPTPRSSAVGARGARQVRAVEHRAPAAPTRSTTRSPCGWPPSRPPRSCFRVTHQLHGAIGFCDETMLSWLSRYSQPLRRLPLGLSAHPRPAGPSGRAARPHRAVRRGSWRLMT